MEGAPKPPPPDTRGISRRSILRVAAGGAAAALGMGASANTVAAAPDRQGVAPTPDAAQAVQTAQALLNAAQTEVARPSVTPTPRPITPAEATSTKQASVDATSEANLQLTKTAFNAKQTPVAPPVVPGSVPKPTETPKGGPGSGNQGGGRDGGLVVPLPIAVGVPVVGILTGIEAWRHGKDLKHVKKIWPFRRRRPPNRRAAPPGSVVEVTPADLEAGAAVPTPTAPVQTEQTAQAATTGTSVAPSEQQRPPANPAPSFNPAAELAAARARRQATGSAAPAAGTESAPVPAAPAGPLTIEQAMAQLAGATPEQRDRLTQRFTEIATEKYLLGQITEAEYGAFLQALVGGGSS